MMSRYRIPHRGFSLVELMTSTALTLLLLAGVLTMIIGSRVSFSNAQQAGEIEEEGRYALERIVRDVRVAGFSGCAAYRTTPASTWYLPQLHWDFDGGRLKGFEADTRHDWPAELIAWLGSDTDPESDVLIAQIPVGLSSSLLQPMALESAPLQVGSNSALGTGDVVLASDCRSRSYFEVTAIKDGELFYRSLHPANLSLTHSLGYAYPDGSELTKVETRVYFVSALRDGKRALWMRAAGHPAEEIGARVDRMSLQYCVADQDGEGDECATGNRISEWNSVHSVKIELLVTADNEASGENGSEVFSAVVSLRNAQALNQ